MPRVLVAHCGLAELWTDSGRRTVGAWSQEGAGMLASGMNSKQEQCFIQIEKNMFVL
jgi:hypothetical protein